MDETTLLAGGLAPAQIEQFITDGFVRIDGAFARTLADEAGRVFKRW